MEYIRDRYYGGPDRKDPELDEIIQNHALWLEHLAQGSPAAHPIHTVAPSFAGTPGQFVRNHAPEELGSAGSKYVVLGWVYSTADTWLACRVLTGN